jgi:hypothetical protein
VLYHLSYGLAGAGVEARAGWVNSERVNAHAFGRPVGSLGSISCLDQAAPLGFC